MAPSMRLNRRLPIGSVEHRCQMRSSFVPVASRDAWLGVGVLNSAVSDGLKDRNEPIGLNQYPDRDSSLDSFTK